MEPMEARDVAERDQLWANLRILRPEIERIAQGNWEGEGRQQLAVLLAKIVLAELEYRAREGSAV